MDTVFDFNTSLKDCPYDTLQKVFKKFGFKAVFGNFSGLFVLAPNTPAHSYILLTHPFNTTMLVTTGGKFVFKVFLSYAYLDHYGSLPSLRGLRKKYPGHKVTTTKQKEGQTIKVKLAPDDSLGCLINSIFCVWYLLINLENKG